MLGAIIGDTIGSAYEFANTKDYDFKLFSDYDTGFTDDSVMTMAVARWLCIDKKHSYQGLEDTMVAFADYFRCPKGGYGTDFYNWLFNPRRLRPFEGEWDASYYDSETGRHPYGSWGNGSAMRVSAVGWFFDTLEETERVAAISAAITHNHPEGIKGAQATAAAIWMARNEKTKEEIRQYIEEKYGYDLHKTWEYWHPIYDWDASCQGTVPQAIIAFLDSTNFEDAIRKAVSLGGDSDTLACITGGIAEAYYKEIPWRIADPVINLVPKGFKMILEEVRKKTEYGKLCRIIEKCDLDRFIDAQDNWDDYQTALAEMKDGHKLHHWIWYIFPQIQGLGHSFTAERYGIYSLYEAQQYLKDSVLGARLREITEAVLTHSEKDIEEIMGSRLDAMKLKSCMTLFDIVSPNDVFAQVIDTFFDGERDQLTLSAISSIA